MTNGCDDFEIAIEQRRAGVLDAAAVARLDAHLAGCPGCAAYRDVATALTVRAPDSLDWNRLTQQMSRRIANARRQFWIHLLSIPVMAAVFAPFFGIRAALLGVAFWLVLFLAASAAKHRRLRAGLADRDVVAAHRRELEVIVRSARLNRRIFAPLVAIGALLGVIGGALEPIHAIVFGGAILTTLTLEQQARVARRELAELR